MKQRPLLYFCEIAAGRIGEWVFLSIRSGEVHYDSLRILNTPRNLFRGPLPEVMV